MLLSLTGCAHYAPEPLTDASDILAAPDARYLVRPYGAEAGDSTQVIDLSAPLSDDAIAALAVTAAVPLSTAS